MRYHLTLVRMAIIKNPTNNFPSGPVVKTLPYPCMKHTPHAMWPKIKKEQMGKKRTNERNESVF